MPGVIPGRFYLRPNCARIRFMRYPRFDIRILLTGAILTVAGLTPTNLQARGELEQHLDEQYKDKFFVLRDLNQGSRLTYDSAGTLKSGVDPGDWTVAGFVRVTGIDASDREITIKAERLYLDVVKETGFHLAQPGGKDKDKDKNARKLRIEISFDPGTISNERADAAFAKVFLTAQDHFADIVPDYWKPCVRAASTGTAAKDFSECRFAPEFAAIPGVVYPPAEKSEPKDVDSDTTSSHEILYTLHRGNGVTMPTAISQLPPPFSDEARIAKYQGVDMLQIIVDKTGHPRNIRIMRPLGMGLDRQAVEAVGKWRFNPATKDGEPVSLGPMAVEVSFHLF